MRATDARLESVRTAIGTRRTFRALHVARDNGTSAHVTTLLLRRLAELGEVRPVPGRPGWWTRDGVL